MAIDQPFRHLLLLALVGVIHLRCGGSTPSPEDPAERDAYDTGGKVRPASSDEQRVLDELPKLTGRETRRVGALEVVAEAPYPAASGRTCRRVAIGSQARLACSEGNGSGPWFFVPDVFGAAPAGR